MQDVGLRGAIRAKNHTPGARLCPVRGEAHGMRSPRDRQRSPLLPQALRGGELLAVAPLLGRPCPSVQAEMQAFAPPGGAPAGNEPPVPGPLLFPPQTRGSGAQQTEDRDSQASPLGDRLQKPASAPRSRCAPRSSEGAVPGRPLKERRPVRNTSPGRSLLSL